MGTNYYMRTADADWVGKHFSHDFGEPSWGEYEIEHIKAFMNMLTGQTFFRREYVIHLSKQSAGWEPLLQYHPDAYQSFAEMKEFLKANENRIEIQDEYGQSCSVSDYLAMVEDRQVRQILDRPLMRHESEAYYIHDDEGYSFTAAPFL